MTNKRYHNIYLDGCSHFCTASVVGYLPLLVNEQVCQAIVRVWEQCRIRYGVRLECYVIMPEHVHLVVRGSAESVRKFMQYSLAQSSVKIRTLLENRAAAGDVYASNQLAFIRSRGNGNAAAKVWKERFRAVALDREDAIIVKMEYIHNNPVRRGMVEHPKDWRWSSYANYHGGQSVLSVDLPSCCGN